MQILGAEGKTVAQVEQEVAQGARFVIFGYTISVLVMTFKRASDIYYLPPGESGISQGLAYSFTTLILGWWGIPWGPIYSIQCLYRNFTGGKDGTAEVMGSVRLDREAPSHDRLSS